MITWIVFILAILILGFAQALLLKREKQYIQELTSLKSDLGNIRLDLANRSESIKNLIIKSDDSVGSIVDLHKKIEWLDVKIEAAEKKLREEKLDKPHRINLYYKVKPQKKKPLLGEPVKSAGDQKYPDIWTGM